MRAIGEPTRLRILMLLAKGELTVKDLTTILGQSQPRISRHLKLMYEAGLLARIQEGSWVYFRLSEDRDTARLATAIGQYFNPEDADFRRDGERAEILRRRRSERAQAFFAAHAAHWDDLRALHVDEGEVEVRMREAIGSEQVDLLVDLGTGTGRILELFSDTYHRGIGIDANLQMLAYARARLEAGELRHAQVRQGDIVNLSVGDATADVAVMHQVLHYLSEPQRAIEEAARILRPGGRLLVVDFSPHQLDHLRDDYAHQRLGLSGDQMLQWFAANDLVQTGHQELPPSADAGLEGLTVSIWLAQRGPSVADGIAGPHTKQLEIAR